MPLGPGVLRSIEAWRTDIWLDQRLASSWTRSPEPGGALVRMGREQDLIVAVKNGDVTCVQKLVAKVKAAKTSESSLGGVAIQLRLLSEYRGYRGMLSRGGGGEGSFGLQT